MTTKGEVTQLLISWGKDKNKESYNRLIPLVYQELHRIARGLCHQYRNYQGGDLTLGPTAVLQEAYLNLIEQDQVEWIDRAHFLAIAAREMRRIMIDYWRYKKAERRGGKHQRTDYSDLSLQVSPPAVEHLALHQALGKLEEIDEESARILDLRYFGGMTIAEVSQALGMGHATVERKERYAKALLQKYLRTSITFHEGTFPLFSSPPNES